MLVFQALEDSNILLKGITITIKNETKEQKGGYSGMFLGTLGAKLLGDILTNRKRNVNSRLWKQRQEVLRAGYGNKMLL